MHIISSLNYSPEPNKPQSSLKPAGKVATISLAIEILAGAAILGAALYILLNHGINISHIGTLGNKVGYLCLIAPGAVVVDYLIGAAIKGVKNHNAAKRSEPETESKPQVTEVSAEDKALAEKKDSIEQEKKKLSDKKRELCSQKEKNSKEMIYSNYEQCLGDIDYYKKAVETLQMDIKNNGNDLEKERNIKQLEVVIEKKSQELNNYKEAYELHKASKIDIENQIEEIDTKISALDQQLENLKTGIFDNSEKSKEVENEGKTDESSNPIHEEKAEAPKSEEELRAEKKASIEVTINELKKQREELETQQKDITIQVKNKTELQKDRANFISLINNHAKEMQQNIEILKDPAEKDTFLSKRVLFNKGTDPKIIEMRREESFKENLEKEQKTIENAKASIKSAEQDIERYKAEQTNLEENLVKIVTQINEINTSLTSLNKELESLNTGP